MTIADWMPALTSSTALAVAGFVAGTWYKARLEKGVQHELDTKLEAIKAKLRQDEEAWKAELRTRDDQIVALRNGALSGLISRKTALDKRRMDAIETIWKSTTALSAKLKMLNELTKVMKMERAIEAAAEKDFDGQKLREFADFIWETCSLADFSSLVPAVNERPFLPPIVWALYSGHQQALVYPFVQWAAMRAGVGTKLLADTSIILNVVKAVLPHQSDYIDKFGTASLPYLTGELEEKLLGELMRTLEGEASDDRNVAQASQILKAVERAISAQRPIVAVPDVQGVRADQ